LANIESAKKRIRQTEKRTTLNRMYRTSARTYIKQVRSFVDQGMVEEAEAVAKKAYSKLDKAARRGVIHPRNAARRKGRLMAAIAEARRTTTG